MHQWKASRLKEDTLAEWDALEAEVAKGDFKGKEAIWLRG
mgnify:CR=1 FL=1